MAYLNESGLTRLWNHIITRLNNKADRTQIPDISNLVTEEELTAKGYLTEHQDISGKLDANKLPEAINNALEQAKQSGTFDGKSAYESAQEGGFTGTEEEFAEKLALDPTVFYVTINESDDGFIADKTLEQVVKALGDGKYVCAKFPSMDNLLIPLIGIVDDCAAFMTSVGLIAIQLYLESGGNVQLIQTSPEEQLEGVKISNPNSLTINVIKPEYEEETIEYDGEQPRDITIVSLEAMEYALANIMEQAKGFANWDNISNKPFEVIKGETVLPLTEVIYIRNDPNNVDYNVSLPLFDIIIGETYQITFNGQDYNCVSQEFISNNGFLGNAHIAFSSLPDTGEPFFIVQEGSDKKIKLKIKHSLEATTTKITVGVKKLDKIKYLDNKYLDFLQGENSFNTIFPLTELTVEESGESYIAEPLSLLKETFYNITINENSYTCQSTELDVDGMSFLALGNLAFANDEEFENTNEPFIILCPLEPIEGIYALFVTMPDLRGDLTLQIDEIEASYQLKDSILSTEIPIIKNASAGQVVSIKAVDEDGKPTEWEAIGVELAGMPSLEGYATEDYVDEKVEECINLITPINIVNGSSFASLRTIGAKEEEEEEEEDGYKLGEGAFAEGYQTTASGYASHAEGNFTIASGYASHAEGSGTKASAHYAHAEGQVTTASGFTSHAEGYQTTASRDCSHAEGISTTASGKYSHTEGSNTTAIGDFQHVQGKLNIADTTSAHIVGNGKTLEECSNAHTLDWDGNAWYSGDVYVGSTSGTNRDDGSKKLATEEYVDTKEFDSIILKSENKKFRLTINDEGVLSATEIN